MVWTQGMRSWRPLYSVLGGQPPAFVPVRPPGLVNQPPVPACPPTNMAGAVVVTALFCMPLGIVGIVFASQVKNKYYNGDYHGAERASRSAYGWSLAGFIVGVVIYIALISI